MSAEWQKIGSVEVCEGTDGVVGVSFDGDRVIAAKQNSFLGWCSKDEFEQHYCQPRHRLVECADGAVMVLSVDEVDGKPRRGAMVTQVGSSWWADRYEKPSTQCGDRDEAIAAAMAYVTAR